jgi:hypothetical protein
MQVSGFPGEIHALSSVREIGEQSGASHWFLIDQIGGNTGG